MSAVSPSRQRQADPDGYHIEEISYTTPNTQGGLGMLSRQQGYFSTALHSSNQSPHFSNFTSSVVQSSVHPFPHHLVAGAQSTVHPSPHHLVAGASTVQPTPMLIPQTNLNPTVSISSVHSTDTDTISELEKGLIKSVDDLSVSSVHSSVNTTPARNLSQVLAGGGSTNRSSSDPPEQRESVSRSIANPSMVMSSAGLSTTAPEGVVAQSGVAGNVGDDPPSSVPFAGTQVCNPVLSPTGVASTPLKSTLSTIDPHLSCVAEEEIGIISWNAQMFQDDCANNHIGRYSSNGTEGDSLSRIDPPEESSYVHSRTIDHCGPRKKQDPPVEGKPISGGALQLGNTFVADLPMSVGKDPEEVTTSFSCDALEPKKSDLNVIFEKEIVDAAEVNRNPIVTLHEENADAIELKTASFVDLQKPFFANRNEECDELFGSTTQVVDIAAVPLIYSGKIVLMPGDGCGPHRPFDPGAVSRSFDPGDIFRPFDPGDVYCFHFEVLDTLIESGILSSANVCSRCELSGLLSTLTNSTTLFGSYSLSTAHQVLMSVGGRCLVARGLCILLSVILIYLVLQRNRIELLRKPIEMFLVYEIMDSSFSRIRVHVGSTIILQNLIGWCIKRLTFTCGLRSILIGILVPTTTDTFVERQLFVVQLLSCAIVCWRRRKEEENHFDDLTVRTTSENTVYQKETETDILYQKEIETTNSYLVVDNTLSSLRSVVNSPFRKEKRRLGSNKTLLDLGISLNTTVWRLGKSCVMNLAMVLTFWHLSQLSCQLVRIQKEHFQKEVVLIINEGITKDVYHSAAN